MAGGTLDITNQTTLTDGLARLGEEMTPLPKDRRRSLVDLCGFPVVIALAARLVVVAVVLTRDPGLRPDLLFATADTQRYLDLAASLLRGEFSTAEGPEINRLPGYPLLLLPGVALGWPTTFALLVQSLLCCLLVIAVVRSSRLIGLGDRAAMAAGILCALEPTLLLWSVQLMAEVELGVIVSFSLGALFAYLRDGSRTGLAMATVLAAGSALVKPVAFALSFVVAFIASFAAQKKGTPRGFLRLFLTAALPGALVLGAWSMRNWSVAGFTGFSTQFSQVNRSAELVARQWEYRRAAAQRVELERPPRGLNQPLTADRPPRIDASLRARLRLHFVGVFRTLTNPGVLTWLQFLGLEPRGMSATLEMFRDGPWRFLLRSITDRPYVVVGSALLTGLNLVYWVLFVRGYKVVIHRAPTAAWASALVILYFALASGGPWGQSRFRIPFVSIVCVLAGAAFDREGRRDGEPVFSQGRET